MVASVKEAVAVVKGHVPLTEDPATHLMILDVSKLENGLRKEVLSKEKNLLSAVSQFGKAGLAIGKCLKELHALLEPHDLWVHYLRRVPFISVATAYRFIDMWKLADETYSPEITERLLTAGIGNSKSRLQKFIDSAKKVGKPPEGGDPAALDGWIVNVKKEVAANTKAEMASTEPNLNRLAVTIANAYIKAPSGNLDVWWKQLFGLVKKSVAEKMETTAEKVPKKPPKRVTEVPAGRTTKAAA